MNINFERVLKFLFPEWQIIEIINTHGFVYQGDRNALPQPSENILSENANPFSNNEYVDKTSNIFWDLSVFTEIEKTLMNEIIGSDTYITALCEAFKRPYVSGYNEMLPKNTIFILGDRSIGKLYSVEKMTGLLKEKRIIRDGKVKHIDLSKYSENNDESVFLSDIYQALYGTSDVILFENYEKAHDSILNIIIPLIESRKI